MNFDRFFTLVTFIFAVMFVIAVQNANPVPAPCYTPEAPGAVQSVPVRYQDVKVPDLDQHLVAQFNNHESIWIRDFFGCGEHEIDPKKCVWEAGGTNGPEWRAARELAKQVYGLDEPRKARFQ